MFRKEYQALKLKISQEFNKLTSHGKEYDFLMPLIDELDLDDKLTRLELLQELTVSGNIDLLPMIERRGEVSGNVIDCYLISSSSKSIEIIDWNDELKIIPIKFNNLSDICDELSLLEEMSSLG